MAFIHCAKCDWSQDDFYTAPRRYNIDGCEWFSWGYSPLSRFIGIIKWLWKPRVLKMDKGIRVHSWKLFFFELARIYRSWKNMKWYTMKSLKSDKNSKCPRCGLSGKGWWVCD